LGYYPLWSSAKMKIIQYGDLDRFDKIQHIADDANVKKYLQVCWQNQHGKINCSTCIKCATTRLGLAMLGKLDDYHF